MSSRLFYLGITTPPLIKNERDDDKHNRVADVKPPPWGCEDTQSRCWKGYEWPRKRRGTLEARWGNVNSTYISSPQPRRKSALGGVGHFKGLHIMKRDGEDRAGEGHLKMKRVDLSVCVRANAALSPDGITP